MYGMQTPHPARNEGMGVKVPGTGGHMLTCLVVRARVSSMGENAQMEPVSTIGHCNGPINCVFVF